MSSEEIINNSVDLGQRHAYTVALTVLRSQPVEVAIEFIQKSLNDLQPKQPVKFCRCDAVEGDNHACEIHKTEVIQPMHSELL